jgi:phosphoribosylglycinamide formyltransferase 1
MTNLAVLVSGNGTNLEALIQKSGHPDYPFRVRYVVSDNPNAYALVRAQQHQIESEYINPRVFPSRSEYERKLIEQLEERAIAFIVLAGFMRILGSTFVSHYPSRVLNIHPSLLPAFPGLNAPKQALDYGVKITGVTVHYVDEGMDTGPIISQQAVPIESEDTLESLTEKLHHVEHQLYPRTLAQVIKQHRAPK